MLDFDIELFYYRYLNKLPTKGQSCRKAVTQSHGSKAQKAMIAGLPKVPENAFILMGTKAFFIFISSSANKATSRGG
jgi:hypothetical protein